jgi:hypothetical protein
MVNYMIQVQVSDTTMLKDDPMPVTQKFTS